MRGGGWKTPNTSRSPQVPSEYQCLWLVNPLWLVRCSCSQERQTAAHTFVPDTLGYIFSAAPLGNHCRCAIPETVKVEVWILFPMHTRETQAGDIFVFSSISARFKQSLWVLSFVHSPRNLSTPQFMLDGRWMGRNQKYSSQHVRTSALLHIHSSTFSQFLGCRISIVIYWSSYCHLNLLLFLFEVL